MPTEPGDSSRTTLGRVSGPSPRRMATAGLALLKFLAVRGAAEEFVYFSSGDIGAALGIPQQSASARILRLLEAGQITRKMAGRKQGIKVTPAGLEILRSEYAEYQQVFEARGRIIFRGKVQSGLGEGGWYISQPEYSSQFREQLGSTPYPGTLNIRLSQDEAAKLERLRAAPGLPIHGFKRENRTFGGARCFKAEMGGEEVAIILPDQTHHADVLELLSPHYLREKLQLKDGDRVEVVAHL